MVCRITHPILLDPEDVCFACEGRGFLPSVDGWRDHSGTERGLLDCRACSGVATAGVFVIRVLLLGRLPREFDCVTHDLFTASRLARRLVVHLRGHRIWRALAVRVVFKPGPDLGPYAERCVFAAAVEMPGVRS